MKSCVFTLHFADEVSVIEVKAPNLKPFFSRRKEFTHGNNITVHLVLWRCLNVKLSRYVTNN